jgi:ferredoxin
MTPFGLRKRLKKKMGFHEAEPASQCNVVYLLPDGSERALEVEQHYSLLMAADARGITISTGRRAGGTCPDGRCGLCRVEILDASGLSEMSEFEAQAMDDHTAGTEHEGRARESAPPRGPNTRLGCHAKIRGSGARIQVAALFEMDSIRGGDEPD